MSQRTDVLEERLAFPADCDPARVLRVRIERPMGPAPAGGRFGKARKFCIAAFALLVAPLATVNEPR